MGAEKVQADSGYGEDGIQMTLMDIRWPDAVEEYKKIERKKKAIDRIAWRAENQQRRDKGGHFK